MAYTVNWATKVVTIPKADLIVLSAVPEIYELDVTTFWQSIHDIQDSEGMPYVDIMRSNAPVTLAGVTFARSVQVINGFKVEFENGSYQVNLSGANNNILEARVQNNVSINAANSAGLIAGSGGVTAAQVWQHVIEGGKGADEFLRIMLSVLAGKVSGAGSGTESFRDVADTKNRVVSTVDTEGNRTAVVLDGA
jgi:hypothetical protein